MTNENAVKSIINTPQNQVPVAPLEVPSPPQQTSNSSKPAEEFVKGRFTQTLYVIGVIIIVIGIFYTLWIYWNDFSPVARVISFFGIGILFSAIGSFILYKKSYLGLVFHTVSAFLLVIGGTIAFIEIESDTSYIWPFGILFFILSIFYLLLALYHKHEMLSLISVTLAGFSYYSAVFSNIQYLDKFEDLGILQLVERLSFSFVVLGFILVFIGYFIKNTWNEKLSKFLYFIGYIHVFFFGLIANEIYNPDSVVNFFLFGGYIVLGFLGAVFLANKPALILSIIATFYFVISVFGKLVGNYSKSIPLLVIFLGVLVIGIGYLSYYIDKKFIKKQQVS